MLANIKWKRLRLFPSIFQLAEGHNAIVSDKHEWHMMRNQLSIKHKWSIFKQHIRLRGNYSWQWVSLLINITRRDNINELNGWPPCWFPSPA